MFKQPSLSQIIKDGLQVFKKEWKILLGVNAALMIIILAFTILEAVSSIFVIPLVLLAIVFVPVIIIVNTVITSRHLLTQKTTLKDIWSVICKKFFKVLITILLVLLIILVAFIALAPAGFVVWFAYNALLPTLATSQLAAVAFFIAAASIIGGIVASITIILSTYMLFSLYITIVEKKWGFKAIGKSFHLVKGNWWQTFGKILVIQLIATAIVFIVQLIFSPALNASTSYIDARTINGVTALVQQLLVLPLSISVVAFYMRIVHPPLGKKKTIQKKTRTKIKSQKKTSKDKKVKKTPAKKSKKK